MLSQDNAKLSQKEQERLGLPIGFKSYTPFPFGSLNKKDSRIGMPDQDFFWIENFIKIGDGRLRTLWDAGPALFRTLAGRTIISFFFYNIAATQYVVVFLSDGSAIQVNVATSIETIITSAANTFYNSVSFPLSIPGACQSGSTYLLISNNIAANGYWIWDGSVLYAAGTIGPIITVTAGGTGYTSVPNVAASGGSGSGATFLASISGGAVTSIQVLNPGSGYLVGETVTLAITGGGGANATATCVLMPFGINGNAVEVFQSRVWVSNNFSPVASINNADDFFVSAPSSLTNFATSSGGLSFNDSFDPFLRRQFTAMRQSNGYLYPIGDSSVSVISNVQTSGSPPATTFNFQNTDPQVGTSWRDTLQPFSRTLLFANKLGVYGLYGGAVTRISEKLDDLFFNTIVAPADGGLTPTAAAANIFGKKVFLLLITVTDPFTLLPRNVMLAWNEKEWFVATQSQMPTYIGTQTVNSNLVAWGTDGQTLFPMFQAPSANLPKRLTSKSYGGTTDFIIKMAYGFWFQGDDHSANRAGINMTVRIDNETVSPNAGYPLPNNPVIINNSQTPIALVYGSRSGDIPGVNLGFDIQSTSPDFAIYQLTLGYYDHTAQA